MKRKRKGLEKQKELEEKFLEENLEDLRAIAEGDMESPHSREEVQEYLDLLEESG